MAMPVPRALLTLEEYDALPEDETAHYELQEGVLVVSPRAARRHQRAAGRLFSQIQDQLRAGWEALLDFEVVVQAEHPATVRAPDLVVVPVDGPEKRVPAAEVALAVEIVSPGSRSVDTYLKAHEYADAGIGHYWLVDLDPPAPTVVVFGAPVAGEGYLEQREVTGELVVAEPFPMRIDLTALTAPRG